MSREAFLEITQTNDLGGSTPMLVRFGAIMTVKPLGEKGTRISLGEGMVVYSTESYAQIMAALAGVKPL